MNFIKSKKGSDKSQKEIKMSCLVIRFNKMVPSNDEYFESIPENRGRKRRI